MSATKKEKGLKKKSGTTSVSVSKANERNVKETTQKSLIEEKSKETLVSKETLDEGTQTLLDNKKEPKEKLSKFEKRQNRRKKEEALLNMRGIPKYFLLLIVETLFIFLSEMIVKVLIGSFIRFLHSVLCVVTDWLSKLSRLFYVRR